MTKKKSQVKAKSPAARKIVKKGSTQPSQTKKSDDQTNMKPKKPDSIQEIKSHTKVAKKTSNVKKKTSMPSKAEMKEPATQPRRKQVKPVELEVAGAFVLCERHKQTINEVISCLESETPFCFLQSDVASYLEYYKEVIIDCFKSKGEIGLLFFDPKFGDDLSVILNKELENIDIALIGSSKISGTRKILVVDNESFAKNLDWELIDSLRLELRAANLGVFSIDPRSETNVRDPNASSVVSSFQSFELPKVNRKDLKILKEYISAHPETSELVDKLLKTSPEKDVKGQVSSEADQNSILQKLGNLITRK